MGNSEVAFIESCGETLHKRNERILHDYESKAFFAVKFHLFPIFKRQIN